MVKLVILRSALLSRRVPPEVERRFLRDKPINSPSGSFVAIRVDENWLCPRVSVMRNHPGNVRRGNCGSPAPRRL